MINVTPFEASFCEHGRQATDGHEACARPVPHVNVEVRYQRTSPVECDGWVTAYASGPKNSTRAEPDDGGNGGQSTTKTYRPGADDRD